MNHRHSCILQQETELYANIVKSRELEETTPEQTKYLKLLSPSWFVSDWWAVGGEPTEWAIVCQQQEEKFMYSSGNRVLYKKTAEPNVQRPTTPGQWCRCDSAMARFLALTDLALFEPNRLSLNRFDSFQT